MKFLFKTSWILGIVLVLASCNEPDTTEIDRLSSLNTQLQAELDSKNRSVEGLLTGLESIQVDMRNISIREGLLEGLTVSEAELSNSPQQQIMDDISLVDGLIKRNRDRIEQLELSMRKSGGQLSEFEKIVANLKLDILDKERNLVEFKEKLIAMEEKYGVLLDEYQAQSLLTDMQDVALHKAYFVYGSKQELIDNGVIKKSGGVLGVGKSWELRNDFNKDYFTEVDIRTVDRVPLSSKKVELLTPHPDDSYELISEGDIVKELRITDSESFWSRSRYLTILIE